MSMTLSMTKIQTIDPVAIDQQVDSLFSNEKKMLVELGQNIISLKTRRIAEGALIYFKIYHESNPDITFDENSFCLTIDLFSPALIPEPIAVVENAYYISYIRERAVDIIYGDQTKGQFNEHLIFKHQQIFSGEYIEMNYTNYNYLTGEPIDFRRHYENYIKNLKS